MLSKQQMEQFRQQLQERQEELLRQLDHFEEALAYLEQSRPPEFSEEAQEEAAANSLKALDAQERKELDSIRLALRKFGEGSYGICEACSKPIEQDRLSALPMVSNCFSCQKRMERS